MNNIQLEALTSQSRQHSRTTYSPYRPAPATSATTAAEDIDLMKDIDRMMGRPTESSSVSNTSVTNGSFNKRKKSFTIYEDDDNPPPTVQSRPEDIRALKRRKDNGNAWHNISERDTIFNEFLDLFDRDDYSEALRNNTFPRECMIELIRMGTRGLSHPLKNIDCEVLEIFNEILNTHKLRLLRDGAAYSTTTGQRPLSTPQDKFEVSRLMCRSLLAREPAFIDRAIKALHGTFELCSEEYLQREENKENA
ncbi:hypothetical protein CkaCkLH20_04285 [Colletotrichum karsti]|uniref:Uncharacterized protein n=1 Tax=Colletotrichum karsti TaxID=1095194 RepID=A0A9P6I7C2_9PEZI|nr:uncharacterized protein CkaCkLH20_04285 [Colletotrichum karsti]KAF9878247.1 hypothetical protein CkaCkLH20_04285 [Colletotrichum karsti]